jgi:glycosyltransferase involved in cell wall biosynthesis
MGGRVKPRIVISGVNLIDFGPLAIFREALSTLVMACGGSCEIVALVQRETALAIPGVTYMEFPDVKGSWRKRLHFEYFQSLQISRSLQPIVWIAMHDITPRVECKQQFVYCHNPSPFYRFSLREASLDPKFGMFTIFYRFLYGIFLHRNAGIIVQQDWIRKEFEKRYGVTNVLVAHPALMIAKVRESPSQVSVTPYRFLYPAFPRTFKNHELILSAAKLLEDRGVEDFEVLLTVDGASNRCGAGLIRRYSTLRSVKWLGSLSQAQVHEMYGKSSCLLFPSKLETWGLPLTEFKATGKPVLAADLPYAHETIGTYGPVEFFDIDHPEALADLMEKAINGTLKWRTVCAKPIHQPFAKDWLALWKLLLPEIAVEVPDCPPNVPPLGGIRSTELLSSSTPRRFNA